MVPRSDLEPGTSFDGIPFVDDAEPADAGGDHDGPGSVITDEELDALNAGVETPDDDGETPDDDGEGDR